MDHSSTIPSHKTTNKFAKTFHKVISRKPSNKPPKFCLLIPQQKLRCCESQQFQKDHSDETKQETKNKAQFEAFVAKLFATVSSLKAAYAELQMAQFPYNQEAIQSADQSVVDELKSLSELKQCFLKKQIGSSPPHVTLMLAEIQEQQSLMKTYEITMKKMQNEIDCKETETRSLGEKLQEIVQLNKSLEKKVNASGAFSILDNVKFSEVNINDFVLVLNYALRSVRNFVKLLIHEMETNNWDIESAANSIQSGVIFSKRDHKAFVFESFVCREMFALFNDPGFGIKDQSLVNETGKNLRKLFFEQFKKLKSVSVTHFLKHNPNSLFGKFLKSKYLNLIHPKMEFSFSGSLNQRKMVNSGEFPETEFFKMFAEMGKRVWLLHCLAFSFSHQVSVFQVKKGSKFSEVYMESVNDDVFNNVDLRVALVVVPGFKVGRTVVQSQVYLSPAKSPVKN